MHAISALERVAESRMGSREDATSFETDEIFMRKIIMSLEIRVKCNHRVRGGIAYTDGWVMVEGDGGGGMGKRICHPG